ncbi:zinc finger and SCAN domain-containing protein 31-like isoform X2 [Homalodisca vitripennis]|nr:zinc finger and SCAN domain-containing protein 31-like isoform X2 [Homalodisca vitripennis]XP_046683918.1 zinc finger and SCAN domain-containing protein 31-like isoform X2 [Homalodisca vitripennis]XP_046683919.1 zinc finger and SCAN domain-containing protein 31-like isoform X2 [Homalodisca vitripennis]
MSAFHVKNKTTLLILKKYPELDTVLPINSDKATEKENIEVDESVAGTKSVSTDSEIVELKQPLIPQDVMLNTSNFEENPGDKKLIWNTLTPQDGIRRFTCEMCSKSFINKKNLVDHQPIHSGVRPFVCDICDKSFTFKSSYMDHKEKTRRSKALSLSEVQ